MHQHGSLKPHLLRDVLCQCRSAETHAGVDPSCGCGHADDPSSASPSASAPRHDDGQSAPYQPLHPFDTCGEHRLKVLFQILDVNGDGGICVNDLTIGLKKLGVHRTEHELRVSVCLLIIISMRRCTSVIYLIGSAVSSCYDNRCIR